MKLGIIGVDQLAYMLSENIDNFFLNIIESI